MKKFFLSLFVFVASAGYVAYQYLSGGSASAAAPTVATAVQPTQAPAATTPVATTQPSSPAPTPTPAPKPAPTPAPKPAPAPKGQYTDGTYTGGAADAYYGLVQIQVVIQNGKLAAVTFLQYPNDRSTSRYINSQAMPILKSEAIAAQSANVSGVSGASDTSAAFVQSLGDALSQAKA